MSHHAYYPPSLPLHMEDMSPDSVATLDTTNLGQAPPMTGNAMCIAADLNFMPSTSRFSAPGDTTMETNSATFDEMRCLQYSIRQFYNDVNEPWNPVSRSSGIPDTLRQRQNAAAFPLVTALPQEFTQFHDAATSSNCDAMINGQASDSGYGSITRHSEGIGSVYSDIDGGETHSLLGAAFSGFHPQSSNSDTVSIGTLEAPSPTAVQTPAPRKATSRRSKTLSGRSTDGHTCRLCNSKVKTLSELKKHEARHSKPHMCEIAGCKRKDGFSTLNDLLRHKQTVHNMDGVKYRCTLGQCVNRDKRWPRADNFRSHLYRVHRKFTCSNDDLQAFIDRRPGHDLLGLGQFPTQAGPLSLPEPGPDGTYPSNAWMSDMSSLDPEMGVNFSVPPSAISHEPSASLAGDGISQPTEIMPQLDVGETDSEDQAQHQLDQCIQTQTASSAPSLLVQSRSKPTVHAMFRGLSDEEPTQVMQPLDQTLASWNHTADQNQSWPGLDGQPGTEKRQRVQLPDHLAPDTIGVEEIVDPRLAEPLVRMHAEQASLECMSGNESTCSDAESNHWNPVVGRDTPEAEDDYEEQQLRLQENPVDSDLPRAASTRDPEPNICAEDTGSRRPDNNSSGASPEDTAAPSQPQLLEAPEVGLDDEERGSFLEKLKSMEREGLLAAFLKELGYHKTEEIPLDDASTEHRNLRSAPRICKRGSGKKVSCPKCSKWYSRPSDLKKHMKRHFRPYPCTHYPMCKKRFGSKNDWKRHENSQHFLRCCEDPRGKHCHSRDRLRDHVQEHAANDSTNTEPNAADGHGLGRNEMPRFWCGFCCTHIEVRRSGDDGKDSCVWHDRFDHVELHLLGRGGMSHSQIRDWVHFDPKVHKVDVPTGLDATACLAAPLPDWKKRPRDGDAGCRTRATKRQRMLEFWHCCACQSTWSVDECSSCRSKACWNHIRCEECRVETHAVSNDDD